ncbi:MAG: histidine kinase [Flavobacteriales bacterium]|nr:histidine kinase [Flavobacteriales bacterium]
MSTTTRPPLFLPDGRFRTGAWLLLHIAFGLVMGYGNNAIWWVRTGEAEFLFRPYPLLFASYHALTAMAMFVLVLRRAKGERSVRYLIAGAMACMALFILLRWAGDQWLMPAIGEQANYAPGVSLLSFALDNILYALLPIAFATLVHLAEQHLMQHQQRTELAYRERLSELDMLRARMAPHFLYNTLNNLYALSQRPGTDLGPALMDLSDLMRYIAKHQVETVALGAELEEVERYIALQALRYDRPLNTRITVEAHCQEIAVPAFLLLPLVENAFKHGDPCAAEEPLALSITRNGARLRINCTNRIGRHTPDGSPATGNHNLARRLALLYGDCATVRFAREEQRYTATLELPTA